MLWSPVSRRLPNAAAMRGCPTNGRFRVSRLRVGYSPKNSPAIFIRGGEPWLMGYCWSFCFHATWLLSLCRIFNTPGPAMKVYARHYGQHFEDDQQYPPDSCT